MLNLTRISLALGSALILATTSTAQESPLAKYDVSMTLYDGAQIVAKPRMVVSAWTTNRFEIQNPDGSQYRAAFTVEPMADRQVLVMSRFDIGHAGQSNITAIPVVAVELGKPAFFLMGRDAGEAKEFRAEMTLRSAE